MTKQPDVFASMVTFSYKEALVVQGTYDWLSPEYSIAEYTTSVIEDVLEGGNVLRDAYDFDEVY